MKSKQSGPPGKMQANRKKAPAESAANAPPNSAKQGKKDWIGEQFRRVYDAAADEPLPEDMQKLLDEFEEASSSDRQAEGADTADADIAGADDDR